jgi:AraC family transcriptional activator of pobA
MENTNTHFTIAAKDDLIADIDIWDAPVPGVYEPTHSHAYYEILVFNKGGGTHCVGNHIHDVSDFDIHFMPANTIHELKRIANTDGYEIIFSEMFLNKIQAFDPKTNYFQFANNQHVIHLNATDFELFRGYFNKLAEYKTQSSLFNSVVALFILQLIQYTTTSKLPINEIDIERNIRLLVNEYYKNKPSLEFYAEKLNMSVNTLQRKSKLLFGKSIIEIQNDKILQSIKYILTNTSTPIKEIVFEYNFYDESHFNRYFKKQTGLTPSQFKSAILS